MSMISSCSVALSLLKMVSADKSKWIRCSATPIMDDSGKLERVVTASLDITELKNEEKRFKESANYDALTGLPNRVLLADRLELAIAHSKRNGTGLVVCLIDLDGFKAVNDTFGHDTGDKVLIEASKRMLKAVRADDTVARLGGDEFVVILTELSRSEDCAVSLYRLLNVLSRPYVIEGNEITSISASIGVSVYPDDKVEAETLLRHADMAMYESKNSGKNKFSFFNVVSDQKIKANHRTINKIKKALAAGEFCLYYQPKVNALTREVVEVEALARWNHPLLGVISPGEFLPLIENDEELSDRFDRWVISEAIGQLHRWQKKGLYLKSCINISPRQFKRTQFIQWLKSLIKERGLSEDFLSYLEFEILETAAIENLTRSNDVIKECKALGLSFALDDFGTGYSSMMHLKELHIDTIKIDRIFVSGMLDNAANMVIVQAIVALGNAFDISVTAEGAENIEQVMSLLELGCDAIQGYAIAHPMPVEELESFIKNFRPDPRWNMASQTLPSKADFELLLALSNHKYWIEMLLGMLEDQSDVEAVRSAFEPAETRFGKWLLKAKKQQYSMTASFKEMTGAYEYQNGKIQEILDTLKKEQRSITQEEKEVITHLSQKVAMLLEKIRKEVESIKKKSDLVSKILEKRSYYVK